MKAKNGLNFFLFILVFFTSLSGFSTVKRDSLQRALKTVDDEFMKVRLLNDLSRTFLDEDFDKAVKLANEALNIAKWNNFKSEIIDSYRILGYSYFSSNNYSKSLENYFHAVSYLNKDPDILKLAKTYRDIAFIFYKIKLVDKTILYSSLCIQTLKEKSDIDLITDCYYYLSSSYKLLGDHNKEILFIQKSIDLKESQERFYSLGEENNRLGIAYYNINQFDAALKYFKSYLDLSVEHKDSLSISRAFINIGSTLHKLEKYKASIEAYNSSLQFRQGNISDSYLGLANIYSELNNSLKATYYFDLALKNGADFNELLKTCKVLVDHFRQNKNYDQAFYYNDLYHSLDDSLKTLASKEIEIALPKYDVEGIEARIAEKEKAELLNENYKLQSSQNRFLIIILTLTFVLAVCLLYIFGKKLLEAKRNLVREKEKLKDISSTLLELKECVTSIKDC